LVRFQKAGIIPRPIVIVALPTAPNAEVRLIAKTKEGLRRITNSVQAVFYGGIDKSLRKKLPTHVYKVSGIDCRHRINKGEIPMSLKDVLVSVAGIGAAIVGSIIPSSNAEDRASRSANDHARATAREERGTGDRAMEREIFSRQDESGKK
jgi:hypothetical protein